MESKELLRMNLVACHDMVMSLIEDMRDAPLTFPTANGGCHPMWVVGNVAWGDGTFLYEWILGEENPLADWTPIFGPGSEPTANAEDYPSFDEVLAKNNEIHAAVLATLESFSEEDLDKPSKAPAEYASRFATNRQVFLQSGLHRMAHRGQLADARRALGRPRLGP